MRIYGPIIESRHKILGPCDACYHAYLVPWVPLFGIFSLWRQATSGKMDGYLTCVNRILVWIFSIDWYLNWPHWTFLSWDVVHWHELGGVHMRGGWKKFFFKIFFFAFWVNRSFRKRFPKNNWGMTLPGWARGLEGVAQKKPSEAFFTFFSLYLG